MARLPITGATALVLGLAVGILGSFSDDLFGGGSGVVVVQVVLWIASGVLLARALFALMTPAGRAPGTHRRTPGRPTPAR